MLIPPVVLKGGEFVEPFPHDPLLLYTEGRQESENTMAIDSISSVAPVIALGPQTEANRPRAVENDTQPNASDISAGSRLYAPENADTANFRAPVRPVALDVEGSLREASAEISRASQPGPMPVDISAAAQSYRTESAAQDQVVVQQQNDSTPAVNVLA